MGAIALDWDGIKLLFYTKKYKLSGELRILFEEILSALIFNICLKISQDIHIL